MINIFFFIERVENWEFLHIFMINNIKSSDSSLGKIKVHHFQSRL